LLGAVDADGKDCVGRAGRADRLIIPPGVSAVLARVIEPVRKANADESSLPRPPHGNGTRLECHPGNVGDGSSRRSGVVW
jgi:hypothetical protein